MYEGAPCFRSGPLYPRHVTRSEPAIGPCLALLGFARNTLTHYVKVLWCSPGPCISVPSASIHPCKHGAVMKKLTNMMAKPGSEPSVVGWCEMKPVLKAPTCSA